MPRCMPYANQNGASHCMPYSTINCVAYWTYCYRNPQCSVCATLFKNRATIVQTDFLKSR
jgi:hypothetical protein